MNMANLLITSKYYYITRTKTIKTRGAVNSGQPLFILLKFIIFYSSSSSSVYAFIT